MKLIIDARMIHHSGIGRYIRFCIEGLKSHFQIVLLLNHSQVSYAQNIGVNYRIFDAEIYSIKEQILFHKFQDKEAIFWSPHYNVPILKLNWRKRIVTIHDVYHLAFWNELNLPQKIYSKYVIQKAVNNSDLIITVSNFSKQEILKYTNCSSSKIITIYNGIEQCSIALNNYTEICKKYKLPDRYILFVGNLKPNKNIIVLLKAFLNLPSNLKSVYKIVIVGKTDGFITADNDLKKYINSNPIINNYLIFTGFVNDSDLDEIYANASLFVFPSKYEGFGYPPLEAMKNGCPVISSNIASLPEVCGNAVLYFDTQNYETLSDKIISILYNDNLRTQLVSLGKARVKNFTVRESIKKHISLINSLC